MELKRQKRMRDKLWRAERDEIHRQGIEARRLEQERKKKIKTLQKAKQPISSELQMPILDPEITWKADQEQLKNQFHEQDEKEEVTIIVDIVGDESLRPLQQDYIAFSSDEDNSSYSSSSESSQDSIEF